MNTFVICTVYKKYLASLEQIFRGALLTDHLKKKHKITSTTSRFVNSKRIFMRSGKITSDNTSGRTKKKFLGLYGFLGPGLLERFQKFYNNYPMTN